MKKSSSLILILLAGIVTINPFIARGGEIIHAAVTANFIKPFKELSQIFEQKSGIRVEATFSSTGNLYSQIINGAPYGLFLSADEERPALLFKNGTADNPFVYAKGEVVLWSARKNFCDYKDWIQSLKKGEIKRISLANPATAPYGSAAMTAINRAGLADLLKAKLINARDIAQAFQYASTEAVDASFCALSAVYSEEGRKGCYYHIKEAPVITQSACILKRKQNRRAAEKFTAFLVSAKALQIKEKYGYR